MSEAAQGIRSVEIGYSVLRSLSALGKAATLGQIAAAAGMTPSKTHRYLTSLVRCGLVEQDEHKGRYDLGAAALSLGSAAMRRRDPQRVALREAQELRSLLDRDVSLAVWNEHCPVIVAFCDTGKPVAVIARVGGRLPACHSGAGRVFLAWRGEVYAERCWQQALSNGPAPTLAGRTLDPAGFRQLLSDIRVRGLARVRGDLNRGVDALCAPLFDSNGEVCMVMTVMAQSGDLDLRWRGRCAGKLREAAERVNTALGYSGTARLQPLATAGN